MQSRIFAGSIFLAAFFLSLPLSAQAYIDPATTTYVIQIISALVITLGITIGVFYGRIRMFFLNSRVRLAAMHIKLFAKKQAVAEPLYVQFLSGLHTAPSGTRGGLWRDSRSFLHRVSMAFIMSLAVAFTFVAFGPYETYALNIDSFNFPLDGVYSILLLATAGLALLLTGLLSVTRGRIFDALLSLLLGLLTAGYVQGNFLNHSLGLLTGDFIDWSQYGASFLVNLFVWALIMALPFLLHALAKVFWTQLVRFVPLILVLVQLISMVSLYGTIQKYQPSSQRLLTSKGIYEIASQDNIVVIILDRLDNRYLDELLADDPHYLDGLDGFVRFSNNTTLYTQTFPSVANFLTGREYMWEETAADFLADAYQNSDFLPGLRRAGYRINLYTEPRASYYNISDLEGIVDNIADADIIYDRVEALKQFMLLSAFRYGPLAFKPFVWTSTSDLSQLILADLDPPPYFFDDYFFYENLRAKRLSIGQSDRTFSFIHLDGPHAPFIINESVEPVPEGQGTFMGQLKGSFRIVYEYLDQLKALGKYEDSTIIIMGDHGERQGDIIPPQKAITGGLLIKPKGSAGKPLTDNPAPTSSANFGATVYEAAGIPADHLAPGYFQVPADAKNVRYLHHWLLGEGGGPNYLLIYEIDGDANNFDNWTLIEKKALRQTATWEALQQE